MYHDSYLLPLSVKVGNVYQSDYYGRPVWALVVEIHPSRSCVFSLVYDHTWGFLTLRWCRCVLGDRFLCGPHEFLFSKKVTDRSCIPPEDVLNFLASRA